MSTWLVNPGVGLAVLCAVMIASTAIVYRVTSLGSPLIAPGSYSEAR